MVEGIIVLVVDILVLGVRVLFVYIFVHAREYKRVGVKHVANSHGAYLGEG